MKKILLAIFILVGSMAASDAIKLEHIFLGQNGPHPTGAPAKSVDTTGGVGPRHLVGFINGGVTVRSKSDGHELQPYQTQKQFWETALKNTGAELVGYPYDPRIFFDPLTSRWFAIADVWAFPKDGGACCQAHILIGVSTDDDPTHPWKAIDLTTRVPVDNVKFGIDKNGFYMTEHEASRSDDPKGAVLAVPKADLLWKGSGAPSLAHMNRLEVNLWSRMFDHKLRGVEGMIPPFDVDPKKKLSDPYIWINRYRSEVDGETIMQVRKLTWSSPTQASISEPIEIGLGTHYPVQPTTRAVQPALPGVAYTPGLAVGEGRLVNAVVRDGRIWTVSATEINNRTAAFWVEVNLKDMKLAQHGTIADPDADILFPSLNVDARGNLGVVVMRSSANEAASTYVTGRLSGDPPNQLRPLVRAVQGRYPYVFKDSDLTKPNQAVSTSDYASSVVDPSDPTLIWSYQFAALNDCMPQQENGGKWAVNWVAFRVGTASGKLKPVNKK